MAIGVKDTQEIIRQAAVLSRNAASAPVKLEPQEVGMATGPRHRKRALLRPGSLPDYLNPEETQVDEWQKLDDDIYKFLQVRKDQFARLLSPPSHQFMAEMESQLKFNDGEYELGSYLGLMRQAADLDQTRQTFVTASERGAFHAFARRLTEGRRDGESFDPVMVKRYLELLDSNQATTFRGLADLFRLVSRAARQPLIGGMREAPAQTIAVMLQVVDLAVRFNQSTHGKLEFQVGPMDVFLGARTVLFNRSVGNPNLSIVKELVLDDAGLYHEDLIEWLETVGVFGSELTLLMPESLTADGFSLQGSSYSAVELVMAAGAKMAKSTGSVGRAMSTLSDAIVHKVQQQDTHKDTQIQSILGHFNRLLQGERRSAARVTQDRQQARFDYMTAIQRASQLARGMQTGQMPAMSVGDIEAVERKSIPAAPKTVHAPGTPAAAILAGLSSNQYENMLADWDSLLGRIRKKLTTKSPVFKSLASQLARVRAIDTCLAYGLTPAGGRCTGRLAKLIQSEELRARLDMPVEIAEALEDAFSRDYPAFLSSLESFVATLYNFQSGIQNLQFRVRDRKPGMNPDQSDVEGELDEVLLRLLMGTLLLAHEMNIKGGSLPSAQFRADGRLRYPDAPGLATLGNSDPFITYCAFLWAGKRTLMEAPIGDLETGLTLMARLTPEWREAMSRKYRELKSTANRNRLLPGLADASVRKGWEQGFEMGFMAEVEAAFAAGEGGAGGQGIDARLLELLTEIQPDIDKACEALEGQKIQLTRERVSGILD